MEAKVATEVLPLAVDLEATEVLALAVESQSAVVPMVEITAEVSLFK